MCKDCFLVVSDERECPSANGSLSEIHSTSILVNLIFALNHKLRIPCTIQQGTTRLIDTIL